MKYAVTFLLLAMMAAAEPLPQPTFIQTTMPQRRDFSESIRWFGRAVNREKVSVRAVEAGRVVSIAADEGASVRQGDLLIELGGPQLEGRRTALNEQTIALKQQVEQAEKVAKLLRESVEQKLAKTTDLAAAESRPARLEAEHAAAKQELIRLESACRIRAGTAGIVAERTVAIGQEVTAGERLISLFPDVPVQVRATLFPPPGTRLEGCSVSMDLSGTTVAGTVSCILPSATAEGATMVWITPSENVLTAGMSLSGTLAVAKHRQTLAAPQDAVMRDDSGQAFLFLKRDGDYRKQPVKTGLASGGWAEITDGLSDTDEVVVQGAYELFHRDFNKIYKVVD